MAGSYAYNTTSPGAGASNREDLKQLATALDPEKTPVSSMLKRSKATALYHEWTVDNLAAPDTSGVIEGIDVSAFADKFENLARLGNRVQKFRRTFKVSDWQEEADSAAPVNIAQAEMKAVKEIKRDIETAILSDNDRVTGTAATAAQLRGLGDWLDSAGPADVPSDYRTPAGSIDANGTSITETQFNNVIDSIYDETGDVEDLWFFAATALRSAVTAFTRTEGSTTDTQYRVTQNADQKTITRSVMLYQTDHGYMKLFTTNPVTNEATDRGYFINPKYLGIADYIPMGSRRLEDQGGGPRGLVDCSLTFECLSPLAHGKIT